MTAIRSLRRLLQPAPHPLARRAAVAALVAVGLAVAWPDAAVAAGPVNLVPPSISGAPIEGRTLTGGRGEWVGKIVAFSRQWQRLGSGGWSDIPGAFNPTYTLGATDVGRRVRFSVSAWGFGSMTTAVSEPTLTIRRRGVLIPIDPAPTGTPTPTPSATPSPTATVAPTATVTPAPSVVPPLVLPAPLEPPLIAFPQAAFRGGLPAVTVRWSGRPAISGGLVQPDGRPVPGAQLWVSSRLKMLGAGPVTLGWVTTNAHGRFVYTPPAGASRAVSFTFADSAAVRRASVAIRVVPRIALRFTRPA